MLLHRREPRRQVFKVAKLESKKLLPPGLGPNLGPYPALNPIIEFDELLRVHKEGCVFKALINGSVFALKVVCALEHFC